MAEKFMLNDVHEGMSVYDNSGDKIGEVKVVHNGAGSMADTPDVISLKEHFDDVFNCSTSFPTVLYEELYREGFVRIRRGFFKSDVLVLPSQIMDLGAEAVFLDVPLIDLQEC